jgi:hypothetical protein
MATEYFFFGNKKGRKESWPLAKFKFRRKTILVIFLDHYPQPAIFSHFTAKCAAFKPIDRVSLSGFFFESSGKENQSLRNLTVKGNQRDCFAAFLLYGHLVGLFLALRLLNHISPVAVVFHPPGIAGRVLFVLAKVPQAYIGYHAYVA